MMFYLSDVVWRDWECGIAAATQLRRESQRGLGSVDKIVVPDISQTSVVNEETVTSSAKKNITYRHSMEIFPLSVLLSKRNRRIWNSNDVLAEVVDGLGVDVVDPLVGGLPDNNPDPEGQVGGHEMNKSKSGKQSKSLNDDSRVDEQEVHLEEGEESLEETS